MSGPVIFCEEHFTIDALISLLEYILTNKPVGFARCGGWGGSHLFCIILQQILKVMQKIVMQNYAKVCKIMQKYAKLCKKLFENLKNLK